MSEVVERALAWMGLIAVFFLAWALGEFLLYMAGVGR